MLVVLPDGHPLAERTSIPVRALDNEPFIVPMGYEGPILHLFEANDVKLRPEFQALNTSTILKLIEEGLGLTILGELALPSKLGPVQTRELDPPFRRQLGLACPSFGNASPAVQLFVQIARDLYA
jgi:DNA-binding transcriptional LysR family regulator